MTLIHDLDLNILKIYLPTEDEFSIGHGFRKLEKLFIWTRARTGQTDRRDRTHYQPHFPFVILMYADIHYWLKPNCCNNCSSAMSRSAIVKVLPCRPTRWPDKFDRWRNWIRCATHIVLSIILSVCLCVLQPEEKQQQEVGEHLFSGLPWFAEGGRGKGKRKNGINLMNCAAIMKGDWSEMWGLRKGELADFDPHQFVGRRTLEKHMIFDFNNHLYSPRWILCHA